MFQKSNRTLFDGPFIKMPYNPNNPYVINDHFFENVNNQSYDQTWTSTLNRLENLLATFLGISSSLLLMYLVLKQTPRQFKDFGRLILLCAALDFIYTVINFLAQLVRFYGKF